MEVKNRERKCLDMGEILFGEIEVEFCTVP